MSKDHSYAIPENKDENALWTALSLTSCLCIIEIAGSMLLNSLALLADAAHMFTDVAALGIALAATKIAKRPADAQRTYGYHRFEILSATFNAQLLFGVAIYILFEAYQRLNSRPEVQSTGMLMVATVGLVVNLFCMKLLSGGKTSSLNLKGAYLEVWSDMLGSIGVIFAAIFIHYTNWTGIDTVVAVGIGLWVLPRTWVLLKESLNILLEGVPIGIDIHAVTKAIRAVQGVKSVHELHIWAITSGKNSLAAHVVNADDIHPDVLITNIRNMLATQFNIFHTTLQCEITPCKRNKEGCNFTNNLKENSDGGYV